MAVIADICSFCGGRKSVEHSVTSLYFAKVTRGARPWPVNVFHCYDCGSRQFSLELSEEELTPLYDDYRGESYFRERHSFEPWYTRKFHESLGSDDGYGPRRNALLRVLESCGVKNEFDFVLGSGLID